MNSPALPRPPRVTTACIFVGLSCAILLFGVGSTLSNWGSIEMQDEVRKVLSREPLANSGLQVDDVMGWLRWALMSIGAVGAAGIIFAIYTARGHQPSRIAVTILCGLSCLMFLAGGFLGILPAAFAIGCGIYLWTPDARRWFAIKNGKMAMPPAPQRPDPFAAPIRYQATDVEAPEAPELPQVPTAPQEIARPFPPAQPQFGAAPVPRVPGSGPRPQSVLGAGLIALIMSSLVALVCGVNALFYMTSTSDYVRELRDNALLSDTIDQIGKSPSELAHLLFVGCCVAFIVALLAIVAAGATLAGSRLGRTVLLILTVLLLPVSVVVFPVGLVWTAGAVTTLVLLLRPESREFFDRPPWS